MNIQLEIEKLESEILLEEAQILVKKNLVGKYREILQTEKEIEAAKEHKEKLLHALSTD